MLRRALAASLVIALAAALGPGAGQGTGRDGLDQRDFPPARSAARDRARQRPRGQAMRAASPPAIVVKYRSEGPHALEECAERISRRGDRFAEHSVDGALDLDALQARAGRLDHRAIFRRTSGTSFRAEARALRERLRAARERRRAMRRNPSGQDAALPDLAHVYRLRVPAGQDAEQIVRALRSAPQVEYAHLDYEMVPDQLAPTPPFDDPFLTSAGSWGQPYADLWGLHRIGAPEVWPEGVGEGVVVAVVDTGLDRSHPDIAANVWVNPGEDLDGDGVAEASDLNGLDDDGNGFVDDVAGFDFGSSVDANEDGDFDDPGDVSDADPFDERGHGTHVAGTIAAVANNGEGIVGVAPGVRLMPVKGFPEEGSGVDSVLWRAVLYAAENGADVINNSWSCGSPCPSNDLATDVLAHVEALGAVVVTSAGNAATDVALRSPENTDAVLTVGAIGEDDALPSFTNRGWGVDLVAPGGGPFSAPGVQVARRNILSLRTSAPLENEAAFTVGGAYLRQAGTSMSAPHVAGAVALARARRPDLGPAAVREWMRVGARELGATGHDWLYGGGALHLPTLFAAAPPDATLTIDVPASGSLVDPGDGPVRFEVVADGADVMDIDVEIAEGLVGRAFAPLEELTGVDQTAPSRSADAEFAVEWDASDASPGPRTLRIGVRLRDGRELLRFRVFGVERIDPVGYTRGDANVGAPATDGRRLAWPMEHADDEAGTGVAVDRLRRAVTRKRVARDVHPKAKAWVARAEAEQDPAPIEPIPFEVAGQPTVVDLDRRLIAWRALEDGIFGIGWCFLEREDRRPARRRAARAPRPPAGDHCVPSIVERPGESLSRPWVSRGWIVWQRSVAAGSEIEGCRPKRGGGCDPVPLVHFDADDPRWRLQSFDGRTLLLDGFGRLARCAVRRDGTPCVPEEIVLGAGISRPDSPVHDGDLLAFGAAGIEIMPPEGCVFGDLAPECLPGFEVVTRLQACALFEDPDTGAPTCEATQIAPSRRVDGLTGPRVSGRRIVWSAAGGLEAAGVTLCEFDARTRTCPPQRITGAIAAQIQPDLAGRNLVWRGARDAGESIWSLKLPGLRGPDRVVPIPAGAFAVPLRAWTGDAGDLGYAVEILEADQGLALAPDLDVLDFGRDGGRVWLVGKTAKTGSGRARVVVVAKDRWGLESRRVIDLEVDAE